MDEITILLPEKLFMKVAQLVKDDGKQLLYICTEGNCMTVKRVKHPESGEDYIEISGEVSE